MNIPQKLWNTLIGVFAILFVFLVIVSIKEIKAIKYVGSNPSITNTIEVSGMGEVIATPDVATFSFTVTENAKLVADAQKAATAKVDAALKAIRAGGVADNDIKTISYNINPHYEYQTAICSREYCPPSKSILTGYDVSQTIEVKVRDLDKAGALFASIGGLSVQYVNDLHFSVDKPEAVNAEARKKAIENAQSKANELAKQLGVKLVRIVSFVENSGGRYPIAYGMGGAKDMAVSQANPAPEIPAGEQKVMSQVDITYEIQ